MIPARTTARQSATTFVVIAGVIAALHFAADVLIPIALALLLAFLKPVLPKFGSTADVQATRTVLLIIDHSLSMEHQGGGVSSRQRAESEADKILATLGPDDTMNVMLAGNAPTTCFVEVARFTL